MKVKDYLSQLISIRKRKRKIYFWGINITVISVSCAPSPGDDLRSKSAIRLRSQNCMQRFFWEFIVRPPTLTNKWCPQDCPDSRRRFFCGNYTVAVATPFAMKNGQMCFSLRKFLAISSAIQDIPSDCGCDTVVHLGPRPRNVTLAGHEQ